MNEAIRWNLRIQITGNLLNACMKHTLKKGFVFPESVYKKYLLTELRQNNLKCKSQRSTTVAVENGIAGKLIAYIIEEYIVIGESGRQIVTSHTEQLLTFTNTFGLKSET